MNWLNAFLDSCRGLTRQIMKQVARALNKISSGKLRPNAVTIAGLLAHVIIAWMIAARHPIWAAGLLVIFGLFDTLDGELARLQNRASKQGMLLDSISDRAKEIMLYVGIAYFFVQLDKPYTAVWAVAACGVSLLISYTNAWGEAVTGGQNSTNHKVNKSFRKGLMGFEIRMFLLVVGLVTALLPEMLLIITVLGTFTAIGRLRSINKKLA